MLPVSLISPWCALLVLALPGLYLLGRSTARRFVLSRDALAVTSIGIGLALWLLAVHAAGLVTHSFFIATWIGTLLPAVTGTCLWRLEKPVIGELATRSPLPVEMLALALCLVAAMAPAAFGWAFHDEITAHMPISAQIANGVYPPRDMIFPAFTFRYHYGFNLLCALLMGIFRLNPASAIDVAGCFSWGYIACLLWVTGDLLFGRGAGWITALVTMLGGRVPLHCPEPMGGPSQAASWLGRCSVETSWIAPPFVSNHFQHPCATPPG